MRRTLTTSSRVHARIEIEGLHIPPRSRVESQSWAASLQVELLGRSSRCATGRLRSGYRAAGFAGPLPARRLLSRRVRSRRHHARGPGARGAGHGSAVRSRARSAQPQEALDSFRGSDRRAAAIEALPDAARDRSCCDARHRLREDEYCPRAHSEKTPGSAASPGGAAMYANGRKTRHGAHPRDHERAQEGGAPDELVLVATQGGFKASEDLGVVTHVPEIPGRPRGGPGAPERLEPGANPAAVDEALHRVPKAALRDPPPPKERVGRDRSRPTRSTPMTARRRRVPPPGRPRKLPIRCAPMLAPEGMPGHHDTASTRAPVPEFRRT